MDLTKKELLELVRAGYTKEDIDALTKEPVPEEKKEEAPEEEEKKEAPAEEKPEADPKVEELLNAFKELREDLKKRSIISDDYQVTDPQERAQEILASIINPYEKTKKQ